MSRITSFLLFFVLCSAIGHAQGSWVQQPTALPSAPTTFVQVGGLWGIALTDTGTGFAAGYASVANGFSGVLRKTAGDPTWYVLPSSNFTNLPGSHTLWSAVTAVGTHAWVCGSNGRLYKTTNNGNTWAEARNGITGTNTLYDIFFKNQNEGMVVGNNATMYYTSDGGANWVQQTLPATVATSTPLYGIHSAGSNWYVSGGANTIIRGTPATSATGWTDLTGNAPSVGGVEGLQFLDNAVGTVGGIGALGSPLYRTTNSGASWTSIGTGLGGTNPYNGVFFFDANNGWVGNAANNIAHTSNGGQNWSTATTTNLPGQTPANWLTRLDFPGNSIGYAAGGAPGTSSIGWILRHETPLLPDMSQTPTSLDFGTLDCDSSMQKVFTIYNGGNADLTLNNITFSSPVFSIIGTVPNTVPAAGGVTFSIRWTPSAPGSMPANAGMTIESDDVNNSPYFVQFSGLWNIGTFALGDTYDFGTMCLKDSTDVSLMITVTGSYSPKIIAFEHVSGPAYVRMLTPDVGATVNGTTQFAFRANPTTVGALSSVYRMISGNPLCPRQQHITFTTSVTNADLSLSPAIVDFGDVCIGESKDLEITVTNNGSEAGVISSRQFVSGRNAFPNQHFNPFGPIPPGESRQYRVRFAPGVGDIGNVEAVYNLIVDPCKDTLRLVLRGRGVRPGITFTPTSVLGLGPVPAGQITEENVTITNSGNATMDINAISLTPLHPRLTLINLPVLPTSLPAGQSITVRVRFDSDRSETILANLCVHWSSPCADSSCLPVAATSGEGPDIEVAAQQDMGTEYCAVAHRDTLWVKNVGGGVLIISRFLLGGSDPAHFTVQAPSTPSQVAPGDSVAVILDFFRPDNGISTAELTIEHDDSKVGGKSVVQLRAERQSVEFHVQGDTLTPFVSCIRIGTNRSLQIRNRGIENLEVREIVIVDGAAEFGVSSTPLPALIPGGSGLSFEVNFTPTLKGVFNATVRVTVGPCNDTYLVNLTGEGNVTELSFTPDPVEFGSVDVGDTDTRIVRISNTGATAVSVSALSLRPGNTEFSLISVPTLPVIINAGASREVTVQFEPQTIGTITGELCATVTSPCPDTLCVLIRGRGSSNGLGVTKTRMEFRLDPCTLDERCDSIELLNSAGTPVSITDVRIEASTGFRVELPEALPFQLAAGARATLRICALADFSGSRTGNLIIESDDVNVPLIRVPLQALRDSSAIRSSVSVLDFGFIAPCEIGSSQFITVHNTGSLSEFVDTLHGHEAFIVSSALPVALQPATLTQLRVTFIPPAFGTFEDTLYLTTTRCDFRVPVVLRGTMLEQNYTVTPVPLEFTDVAVGSSEIRNFSFNNLHLPHVRISDVRISPGGTFASWGAYPKTVPRGDVVELPILYNPQNPGPHSATACIIIDLPCPDTLCIPLNGRSGDGTLVAIPPELAYGIIPQCADSLLYDTLRNIGGGSITLRSSRVEGNAASLFTLENPILAPEQLASGAERVFEIRARSSAAAADGDYEAELIVETDNSAQPKLTVPLSMERRTLRISDDMTVDYGTIYVNAPSTRSVTLVNRGTMDLVYRSGNLPAGVTIEPSLPISIPPGGSVVLDITYTPRFAGSWESTLPLQTGAPCNLTSILTLRGTVRENFTVTDVDFGDVPHCRASSVVTTVLHNPATVGATIISAVFEGNTPGTFTLTRPDTFPVPLPASSSFEVEIVYEPDPSATPAAYMTTLVLTTENSGGTQQHRVAVSVHVKPGRLALLTTPHFGEYTLGRVSHVLQASFRNDNNFPITIDAADIGQSLPGNFSLVGTTPELPVTLNRSEVLQLSFVFETDVEGRVDARLQLQQSAPCPGTDSYDIYAFGVDDAIRAELSIDDHTGTVDEIIHVPIRLHTDLDHTDVMSWEGRIAFNPSMLHPLAIVKEGTLSADMEVSMTYDFDEGELLIQARNGLLRPGIGELATLRFLVLIGDAEMTPLALRPGFEFTSGRARIETRQDGSFSLLDYCDVDGRRFISPTTGLIMQPNRPNPFSHHTVIEYETADDGPVDLRVYDRMGREVAQLVGLRTQPAGMYRVKFDTGDLLPGVYFAILRNGTQAVVRKMLRMP